MGVIMLNNKALKWLLESKNPAIKYRTLTELCGKSQDDENVQALYKSIWEHKPIVEMLKKQDENGLWKSEEKYYGSFTPLRYLTAFAEHGLHKDEKIDRFVQYTINNMLENNDDPSGCDRPLVLRALVMLGYHENDKVKTLIENFANAQLNDGGYMCKRLLNKKPDRKSCYKASIAGLLLYAECKKKNILPSNSDNLVNYFLKRNVFYSSDKTKMFSDGRFGWRFIDNFFPVEPMRMGLPLIVSSLSILGVGKAPELAKAWELLEEKKDEDGKILLDGTLTKQPCSFGKVGMSNEWVTFYALLTEKHYE